MSGKAAGKRPQTRPMGDIKVDQAYLQGLNNQTQAHDQFDNLPEGVRIAEPEAQQNKIIPKALRMAEGMVFSDFSKIEWAFKEKEGYTINKTEKILSDNLWVAFKRRDASHMVASINGLHKYLSDKNDSFRCYVVFNGPQPGIYKIWAAVTQVTRHSQAKYKKYATVTDAYNEASTYIGPKMVFEPELRDEIFSP